MFSSLQSDQSAELEAQTSKLDKGSILLSSLAQGQEEQRFVALGEVSLCLGTCGTPACSVTTKKVLEEGPKRGSRSGQSGAQPWHPHLSQLLEQQGLWVAESSCVLRRGTAVSFRARRWL